MDAPPPAGRPTEAPSEAIAYIREHRSTYTQEALEDQLRAAGHTPEAIAAAWDAIGDEAPPEPGVLPTILAILATILAVVAFGGSALVGLIGARFIAGTTPHSATVLALYGVGAIVAGIGVLLLIRRGRRAGHAVLGVVGATGVATVTWLAISGLCLATWEGLAP